MKRILSVVVIGLMLFCLAGCGGQEALKPTENFYVNDFADVISDRDESEILSKAVALNQKTTAQVVVVTVESLDGKEPWEYALELGREWGVGDKEKDNGVVILLSESDRRIEIATGYGLEGAIPDSKAGRIIDVYGLEYLKQNDFSRGITAIADAVINEVYIEYGFSPEEYTPIDKIKTEKSEEDSGGSIIYLIILIVLFAVIFAVPTRRRGFIWYGGFGGGFNSRGGGFGGGGFRGGGGSFGGGGAGRGF